MSGKKFPVFETKEDVRCFRCDFGNLGDFGITSSGYAAGSGEFRADCRRCGAVTWFDLSKPLCPPERDDPQYTDGEAATKAVREFKGPPTGDQALDRLASEKECRRAAAYWELLAESKEANGGHVQKTQADLYRRTAKSLTLEAETGKPHCACCLKELCAKGTKL